MSSFKPELKEIEVKRFTSNADSSSSSKQGVEQEQNPMDSISFTDQPGSWSEHEGHAILNMKRSMKNQCASRFKISQWLLKTPFAYRIKWLYIPLMPGNFQKQGMSIGELLIVTITTAFVVMKILDHGTLGTVPDMDDLDETGEIAVIFLALTFATAAHNSVFSVLFGLPFERAMFWHAWFATLATCMATYHGCLVMFAKGNIVTSFDWATSLKKNGDDRRRLHGDRGDVKEDDDWDADVVITGLVAAGAMIVTVLYSLLWPIRRKLFEVFYYFHILFAVAVVVGALLHGARGFLFGVDAWLVDVLFRYGFQAYLNHSHKAGIKAVSMGASELVEITIPVSADFVYRPGQYIFLCIPKLSLYQWHPFSISSSPTETCIHGNITVHAKVLGDWTQKLLDLAKDATAVTAASGSAGGESKLQQASTSGSTSILFEGPLGDCQIDIEGKTYEHIVLCSGGIGITPMRSTLQQLVDECKRGRKIANLSFIWSCRETEEYNFWHNSIFSRGAISATLPASRQYLDFRMHVTKGKADNVGSNLEAQVDERNGGGCIAGRPDYDEILTELAERISINDKNSTTPPVVVRIAVLGCGPDSMMTNLAAACYKHSVGHVVFDLHLETFEL